MSAMHNLEMMTLDQLIGRLMSSSWAPARGSPEGDEIERKLAQAFEKDEPESGRVEYDYATLLIMGAL